MPTLTLSAEHKYTLDGKAIPGVTEIIGQYIRQGEWYINVFSGTAIPAYVMHDAQDRGKAIHKAIRLILAGRLNWDALDPALVPPLRAFEVWMKHYKPQVIMAEVPIYSPLFQYGGTPDLICRSQAGVISIVEYKTSEAAASMAGPQTAAYEQAYRESIMRLRSKIDRYVLVLPESGRGSFEQLTSKDDWNFFKARLYQFNYLRGKR